MDSDAFLYFKILTLIPDLDNASVGNAISCGLCYDHTCSRACSVPSSSGRFFWYFGFSNVIMKTDT